MTSDLSFLDSLSSTQEHFLKKFLVEACLRSELQYLSKPHCLEYIGAPFKSSVKQTEAELPLLRYFFTNFVASFPFITMNTKADQVTFWRDTVQPFVESFNGKRVSNASQRKTNTTKRHQVNQQLLRALLLFYNSMLSSRHEIAYLEADHLKPSDQGKLDKISKTPAMVKIGLEAFHAPSGLDDYSQMVFSNNYNINIVAVDTVVKAGTREVKNGWSFNPLRLMGSSKKSQSTRHYVFILHVVKRSLVEGNYQYKAHFIPRTYADFRSLERVLKSKFPGLMSTEIHAMPAKIKHDSGVRNEQISSGSSEDLECSSGGGTGSCGFNSGLSSGPNSGLSCDPNSSPISGLSSGFSDNLKHVVSAGSDDSTAHGTTFKYYGDKLRLALRGYINTLLHKREIANCEAFGRFISNPEKNFKSLSPHQIIDYEQRMELEKTRLVTQEEFQNHIARQVYELGGNFERFKKELLDDPHQLSKIFVEIGRSASPEEMSPLVTSFIEWCKLEIAATLYQMFLTQDNSSQWLQKCRKFHRMFPYKVCYGILKYTNPIKIMSRMVDLLLMNVPSFGRKSNQAHNLLSMIFIMLLDEDLQDFSKERVKLLATEPLNRPEFSVFFTRIVAYVNSGDASLQEDLQEEHLQREITYFLSVLSSDLIEPKLSESERAVFDNIIMPSYTSYQNLNKEGSSNESSVYVTLKQFWQLEVRTRDKEIFKQLWKEPELTQLIKRVLTVFYQPLMTVMKKCNVHLVFLDFQHFLDDLLAELTELDEGDMYFTSSVEMFNRFKKLLDKYEGTFYRFLHDLHNKDDGKLFLNLVAWIESFLIALRRKFTEPEKVSLDFASMKPSEEVDESFFMHHLNSRIELILKKRFLLKSCIKNAAHSDAVISTINGKDERAVFGENNTTHENKKLVSHQKAIDQKWETMNDGIFNMSPHELGLSGDDLEEFNLTHVGDKAAAAYRNGHGNAEVMRQITELDKLINETTDTEIQKLVQPTQEQLTSLVDNLGAPKASFWGSP